MSSFQGEEGGTGLKFSTIRDNMGDSKGPPSGPTFLSEAHNLASLILSFYYSSCSNYILTIVTKPFKCGIIRPVVPGIIGLYNWASAP